MSRVLVTGATMPIGRALVGSLLTDPEVEHVLATAAEARPVGLVDLDPERLTYVPADLTRDREIRSLLFGPARERRIDVVVHSALHRSARRRGPQVHALNVESTRELLRLSERHPTIGRFVYRSYADVYRLDAERPVLVAETHPLELGRHVPAHVLDRVEADVAVSTRLGLSPLQIAVLRCAEIFADATGSQLWDYLASPVCFRPLGFDPMLNLLSMEDAVRALHLAVRSERQGVFNVPGADTLPLSRIIAHWGRVGVPVPGPLLAPLYGFRASAFGMEFRYDMNFRRFHFSGVLDGRRAREQLGFEPRVRVRWHRPDPADTGEEEVRPGAPPPA